MNHLNDYFSQLSWSMFIYKLFYVNINYIYTAKTHYIRKHMMFI